jgi:hypothetical protein
MQRAPGDSAALPALRDDYPRFRIWRETTGTRTRYIARRLSPGAHPHTVVTSDLSELRAELAAGASTAASTPEPGPAMPIAWA